MSSFPPEQRQIFVALPVAVREAASHGGKDPIRKEVYKNLQQVPSLGSHWRWLALSDGQSQRDREHAR